MFSDAFYFCRGSENHLFQHDIKYIIVGSVFASIRNVFPPTADLDVFSKQPGTLYSSSDRFNSPFPVALYLSQERSFQYISLRQWVWMYFLRIWIAQYASYWLKLRFTLAFYLLLDKRPFQFYLFSTIVDLIVFSK